jgi:hypothetical protein
MKKFEPEVESFLVYWWRIQTFKFWKNLVLKHKETPHNSEICSLLYGGVSKHSIQKGHMTILKCYEKCSFVLHEYCSTVHTGV